MTDSEIQLAPDGSGKQVDTGTVTTGAGAVYRQRVAIGDPGTGANLAAVAGAAPAATAFGLVTRPINQNCVQTVNLNPSNLQVNSAATFASADIDLGDLSSGGASYSKWRVIVVVDQPGAVDMRQSPDNSTFYSSLASQPVAAGTADATVYESLIVMRYLKARFTNNGGSATTTFIFRAILVSI